MTNPVVDLLVAGHPAQSLSTKMLRSGIAFAGSFTVGRMICL